MPGIFNQEIPAIESSSPEDCYSICATRALDADEHAAGLNHWKQDYEQLSAGLFHGTLEEIWFDNIQFFRERTDQVVHETGQAWEGSRTIGVPIWLGSDGSFSGNEILPNSLITLGDGGELNFRTPQHLDVLAVTVDAASLREYGEQIWQVDTEQKMPRSGLITPPAEATNALRQFLLMLLSTLEASPKRDYQLAHIDEPVTVADLCTALKISRRTLQYSFQAVLNVNPVAWLRATRMNGVRRSLKAARHDPRATVSDLAARWGFWHLSAFAADYKLMFGELPSQTLRQTTPAVWH
jgi:AraC family ethanolamine operon transcriptional activator